MGLERGFGGWRLLGTVIASVAAIVAGGCAQGARGPSHSTYDAGTSHQDGGLPSHDSGTPLPDAGPSGVDAGPSGTDAGPSGVDAGPSGIDAGPSGTDAGPAPVDAGPMDAGHDAGPSGTDAGPMDAGHDAGPPPVDAGSCSESPCKLVLPQCGCVTGQGCYLNGSTPMCSAAGIAGEGATCTGLGTCSPGLACLTLSSGTTPVNECNRFCASDTDCRGAGSLCVVTLNDGSGGAIPGVTLCSHSCDPRTSTGCVTGASCQIFQESTGAMRFFTDCAAPVGTGGQGAACTASSDCRRGYGCVGMPGMCMKYCDAPGMVAAGGCGASQACYGFMTPLVVAGTEYGVCDAYP